MTPTDPLGGTLNHSPTSLPLPAFWKDLSTPPGPPEGPLRTSIPFGRASQPFLAPHGQTGGPSIPSLTSLPPLACLEGLLTSPGSHEPLRSLEGPPGGTPNPTWPYSRASLSSRTSWEDSQSLPTLWKGLPTPTGTSGGPPDHSLPLLGTPDSSRPFCKGFQSLGHLDGTHYPSQSSGRSFRHHLTLQEGLTTSPRPPAGPPDPSWHSWRASRPLPGLL